MNTGRYQLVFDAKRSTMLAVGEDVAFDVAGATTRKLSTAEASSMRLWADLNENGRLDSGELQGVGTEIKSADYGFYTRGNGRAAYAGASGTVTSGVISVSAAGNACNDAKYRCAA